MSNSKLGYLVLCDAHAKVAGKDCILGIFNRMLVGRFPAVHESCYLAFEVFTAAGDHQLGVRIRNSEGTDVVQPLGPLKMTVSAVGQASGAIQLRNLPLEKAGTYTFEIQIDGDTVGTRDLMVEPVPQR